MPVMYREPSIIKKSKDGRVAAVDMASELLNSRVLLLEGEVNDATCNGLIKSMLVLEHQSATEPITLIINSPGGSVTAGLALIDTMQSLDCPVITVGEGVVASMAAVIRRMTALSRPSLKLGTHSMILWDIGSSHLNSYTSKINNNREKSEKTVTKQAAFCENRKARCTNAPGQDCSRTKSGNASQADAPRLRRVICRWSASPRPYTRNPAGGFRRCRSSACR